MAHFRRSSAFFTRQTTQNFWQKSWWDIFAASNKYRWVNFSFCLCCWGKSFVWLIVFHRYTCFVYLLELFDNCGTCLSKFQKCEEEYYIKITRNCFYHLKTMFLPIIFLNIHPESYFFSWFPHLFWSVSALNMVKHSFGSSSVWQLPLWKWLICLEWIRGILMTPWWVPLTNLIYFEIHVYFLLLEHFLEAWFHF